MIALRIVVLVTCACGRVGFDEKGDAGGVNDSQSAEELCVDLVAHFKLDETGGTTALDSVSGTNASVNGTVLFDPAGGIVGGAASFSVDGFIDVARTQDLPVGDFTWSVWIKPADLVGRMLIQLRDAAGMRALSLKWASSADVEFVLNESAVFNNVAGFVDDSTWQHIVITRGGSAISVYRNGIVLDTTTDGSLINLPTGCVLRIGAVAECAGGISGTPQAWQGLIDDVRAYDRELPAPAIDMLYRASLAGDVPSC